jgi:dienelactone hydrolase
MTMGAPSDRPRGIDNDWRRDPGHIEDVRCLLRYAREKLPGARIYAVGSGEALTSVLRLARTNPSETEGYIVIGGDWSVCQNEVYAEKKRFLLLHATNHECPPADFYDAAEASRKNGLALVEAGYADIEPDANCSGLSHNGLVGLDSEFGKLVVDWLKGEPIPQRIGAPSKENDLREEVHYFASTNLEGKTNRLQMTLFLPRGKGPFPLVVYNHGDMLPKAIWQTEHLRYTEYAIYHAFLSMGVAVALPARAGVGKSEGEYYRTTLRDVRRDALTSCRINAPDILAAVGYLRNLPSIDRDNIVLAGTSSGGMTSLYIASKSPAWLRGVIDFSGGITDVAAETDNDRPPTSLNPNMVNGLKIVGLTSHAPTLWLFTENDSRYSVKSINASYEAYTKAGGIATLKLFPPVKGEDGHVFVSRHPEMWTGEVKLFLDSLGPPWANRQGSN